MFADVAKSEHRALPSIGGALAEGTRVRRLLRAELCVATPPEGGRNRAIQGGYHAQWWVAAEAAERWVGSGPVDFGDEQRSIKPVGVGRAKIRPMDPASWHGVGAGSVLHLRERVGQTLGVATVASSIDVPADAPLRLSQVPLRSGG